MPLPEAFGAVFGFWLKDRNRTEMVFAKADGKPLAPQGGRVPRIQETSRVERNNGGRPTATGVLCLTSNLFGSSP